MCLASRMMRDERAPCRRLKDQVGLAPVNALIGLIVMLPHSLYQTSRLDPRRTGCLQAGARQQVAQRLARGVRFARGLADDEPLPSDAAPRPGASTEQPLHHHARRSRAGRKRRAGSCRPVDGLAVARQPAAAEAALQEPPGTPFMAVRMRGGPPETADLLCQWRAVPAPSRQTTTSC